MTEPAEPELIRTPDEMAPPATRRATGPWPLVLTALFIGALLMGGWWYLRRDAPPAEAPVVETAPSPAPAPDVTPLGTTPFPAEVPPLGDSDSFVRTWAPRLSAHPRLAAWLTSDDLIRNFVLVVTRIADGRTPAGQIPVLKPTGTFQVVERGEDLFIDARSFARYNDVAEGFVSLDPATAAQLYATLKPRIEEAHAELGGAGSFDATLERAIVQLVRTPIPGGPIQVEPSGIGYRPTDPRLAELTGAQQHLLRMGPVNARRVQTQLRALALALGVPASRMPAPPR